MSLMGVDIGTTGSKAVVFDEAGRTLAHDYRAYPLTFPGPGQCELRFEEVWEAVQAVIRSAAAAVRGRDPVRALGFSTLGDSVTPIDRQGNPLCGTVIGAADRRAVRQAERLERELGRQRLFELTGAPPDPFTSVAKILWFRDNRPEIFRRAWKFCGPQEIVHLRLGLQPRMDCGLAGRTMLLDLRRMSRARELLAAAGLAEELFFPLARADQAVGRLGAKQAGPLELEPGVTVITGGFDQSLSAFGSGVIRPGSAGLSVGTLECINPMFDQPRIELPLLEGHHGCFPGPIEGTWSSLAYVTTSGAVVQWYRDKLAAPEVEEARRKGIDPFQHMMSLVPDRPSRVYVLPYFEGCGNPWMDVHQLGAMFGLRLDTDRPEILKGILDGIAFEIRLNLGSYTRAGVPIRALRATGGGARSDLWMQLKADVAGVPIERTVVTEAGCFGAAFLAGLAIGAYRRPEDILGLVEVDRSFEPRPEAGKAYEEPYGRYLELRRRVDGLRL